MAVYKPNVQYVRFYTDGSAAKKLDFITPLPATLRQPKVKKYKRKKIYVDPVALMGAAVALCMLVVMAVGLFQFRQAREEKALMQQYVAQLAYENEDLRVAYADSYDLEEVEQMALAVGMIPSSQAAHTQIRVTLPQPEQQPTLLQSIGAVLTQLFA